jgi:hypothetical protein
MYECCWDILCCSEHQFHSLRGYCSTHMSSHQLSITRLHSSVSKTPYLKVQQTDKSTLLPVARAGAELLAVSTCEAATD